MEEQPPHEEQPPQAEEPSSLNGLWVAAGFGFAMMLAVVIWLAITVTGLRSQMDGGLQAVNLPAEAEAIPEVPAPTPTEPPTKPEKPSWMADDTPEAPPEDEPKPKQDGIIRVAETGSTDDGPSVPGEYQRDPTTGGSYKHIVQTKDDFLKRLARVYPDVASDKITPEDHQKIQDAFCRNFKAEMAVFDALNEVGPQGIVKGMEYAVNAAIWEKWIDINTDSEEEAIGKADQRLMWRMETLLPPNVYKLATEAFQRGDACQALPGDGVMQEHAFIFKSLARDGFRTTMETTENMFVGTMVPPPPKGVDANDPEYRAYIARLQTAMRSPDAKPAPGQLPEGHDDAFGKHADQQP